MFRIIRISSSNALQKLLTEHTENTEIELMNKRITERFLRQIPKISSVSLLPKLFTTKGTKEHEVFSNNRVPKFKILNRAFRNPLRRVLCGSRSPCSRVIRYLNFLQTPQTLSLRAKRMSRLPRLPRAKRGGTDHSRVICCPPLAVRRPLAGLLRHLGGS